jgi:hypothetical protein
MYQATVPSSNKPAEMLTRLCGSQALQGETESLSNQLSQEGSLSRAGSGQLLEGSGASFIQLLKNVSLNQPNYMDSSEIPEGADVAKTGVRVRMRNYFNRQKVET